MNRIVFFIASLFSLLSYIYSFGRLKEKKLKIKFKDYIMFSLFAIIEYVTNFYISPVLSALFAIVYLVLLCKHLYNTNLKDSCSYIIIIWISSVIIDMLILAVMNITNIVNASEELILLSKSISSIFLSICLMIIYSSSKICRTINKVYKTISNSNITLNMIILIIILIIFFTIGLLTFINRYSIDSITILLIISFMIILVMWIIIALTSQVIILYNTSLNLEKEISLCHKILTDYRIKEHNLKHQLIGILNAPNNEKSKLINDLLIKQTNTIINYENINIPIGLNGIIYDYLNKYKEYKIDITIKNNIKKNIINKLSYKNYNLFCESLGIVLTNALESVIACKEKTLYIKIYEDSDYIYAKVINSFNGVLNINKLGNLNYTVKRNGHGLGLFSLFHHKNINVKIRIVNQYYNTTIKIKKRIIRKNNP